MPIFIFLDLTQRTNIFVGLLSSHTKFYTLTPSFVIALIYSNCKVHFRFALTFAVAPRVCCVAGESQEDKDAAFDEFLNGNEQRR